MRRMVGTATIGVFFVTLTACAANGSDPSSGEPHPVSAPVSTPATTGASPAPAPPSPSPTSSSSPSSGSTSSPATPTTPQTDTATTGTTPTIDDLEWSEPTAIGNFDTPVGLALRPGDPAIYVIEQGGRVIRVEGDESPTVLDVSSLTDAGGERGLLGLAFHPTEPLAYIDYTDTAGDTVVAEYAVGADGTFDAESARIVWQLEQPYGNHNGGDLAFGPDAMLYIAVGDGGSGGDPERRASDPSNPFGSLVRIDPTGRVDGQYTIPADNPFGNEVWAYGLRNPWRFAFDPTTGGLLIGDVGQNEYEELDWVGDYRDANGANFGWSAYEGTHRYNDDVEDPGNIVWPVVEYDHSDGGCSISGAAVVDGWRLFADYCTGILSALSPNGQVVEVATGLGNVSAVRNGHERTVYALDLGGPIYQLTLG